MSLQSLHRISCVVFNKACNCNAIRSLSTKKPILMTTELFCAPIAVPSTRREKSTSKSTMRLSSSKHNIEADDTTFNGKIKNMWKNYGKVAIGTYFTVYVSTLASIFFSLDFDVFSAATFGFDPIASIKKVCDLIEAWTGNTALPGYIRENPRVGTFAIAWIMTKFTEPVRLGFTVAIVPQIARLLGTRTPEAKETP